MGPILLPRRSPGRARSISAVNPDAAGHDLSSRVLESRGGGPGNPGNSRTGRGRFHGGGSRATCHGSKPGPDIQPVQLQVVCHRLWNQLSDDQIQIDLELVKAHGDVSDALGGFYAESVAAVAQKTGAPERDLRAWFDEHLITKQGIRGQMLWESGQSTGLNDEAIRELIDTHLVRAESRRGATWLELAHDRLIDPVRANNDTWYQVNLSALQQQARLWQSQGRAPGFLLSGEALTQAEPMGGE